MHFVSPPLAAALSIFNMMGFGLCQIFWAECHVNHNIYMIIKLVCEFEHIPKANHAKTSLVLEPIPAYLFHLPEIVAFT